MRALQPDDPQAIGPYRLLRRLGSGGMGQVFLGLSAGGRLVAVKIIHAGLALDPEFRARFRREIAAARKVSGLFTAAVVDADVDGPTPWLATAYVAGPSLAEAVSQYGPLPAGSVLPLAAGLAESLTAIHSAGVVHRDLKPSNVLLAADGPRVIDFGISRATEVTSLTRSGLVLGSPGFMSPEQAEGREVGPPSDIFSLGAVLAFAATGEGPFGGGSTAALVYRVVHAPANLEHVPHGVRPFIERCLVKEPSERPTARDLLAEAKAGRPDADWLPASLAPVLDQYTHPPADAAVTGLSGLAMAGAAPAREPATDAARSESTVAPASSSRTRTHASAPAGPGDSPRGPARGRRRSAGIAAAAAVIAASVAAAVVLSSAGSPPRHATVSSLHSSGIGSAAARPARSASPRRSSPASPHESSPASPHGSGLASPVTSAPVQPRNSPAPAAGGPAAGYARAVLADHPVAYWQFAGAAQSARYADSSGHGNALPVGLTTLADSGSRDLAGAISTADGGTYTTNALGPLAGDAARTVEAWFKTTSTGCLLSAGSAAHAQAFTLCLREGPYNAPDPGTPGFYFETYDADIFIPVPNLTDGNWHYLAVAVTGNTADIVIDGTEPAAYIWDGLQYGALTAQPFALPYTPDTAPSQLGVATAGLGNIGGGLIGAIAELAVYPRALSTAELVRHYQLVAR